MFLFTTIVFGQIGEVQVTLIPSGAVVNEFDTIYNLEISIDQSVLQNSQNADLFIDGMDSTYTVQSINLLSPGNSENHQNGKKFLISTENNKKKIVMQNVTVDDYSIKLILTRPDGQSVIERKNQ